MKLNFRLENLTFNRVKINSFLLDCDYSPRFFDQVGHETMHLVEISIFSLNLVIVRLTKIMNRADKNWAQFKKIKYLKNQNFQKDFLMKVGLLVQYYS